MNWVAQVSAGKWRIVHLKTKVPAPQNILHYILRVESEREEALAAALKGSAHFLPEEYGEVLYWGYGDVPNDVRDQMKEKYKFNVSN